MLKQKYGDVECDMYMESIDGTNTGIDEISEINVTYECDRNTVASICIQHLE